MLKWRACTSMLLAACLLPPMLTAAAAQTYPSKPVRVIATSGAGGLSDIFMRALGEELTRKWGQQVLVDNRPGGHFNIGLRACSEAEPDGYTICIIGGTAVTYNPHLFRNLPFDIKKSVVPITNVFAITQALGVNSKLNVKSLDELIAHVKQNPGKLSYMAPSTPLILFMDNLNKDHGIDLVRVPFKGGGDTMSAVLGGTTPIAFLGIGNMMTHIKAGAITPVLVDSEKRSPLVPHVPALGEIDYKGPITRAWFGLFAPPGVPQKIIEQIAADVREVASQPKFVERSYTQRGLEPVLDTPAEFAKFVEQDREAAKRVVEQSGMKPFD